MDKEDIKQQPRQRELRQIEVNLKQIEEIADNILSNDKADIVIALQAETIKELAREIKILTS
ncbi:hypothetical protein [Natronospora cellulosivora (SeqCode)]